MHIKTLTHLAQTESAKAKRKATFARYPKYRLWWVTTKTNSLRTTIKGKFLNKVASLEKVRSLKKLWFEIEYAPKRKALVSCEGSRWDLLKNESIEYSNPRDAIREARIFASKSEIDGITKGLK